MEVFGLKILTAHSLDLSNMKTLSQEEYQKLYGQGAVSQFSNIVTPQRGIIKDVPSDLAETAKGVFGAGKETAQKLKEAVTTPGLSLTQRATGALVAPAQGVARTASELVTGAAKLFTTDEFEKAITNKISSVGEKVATSDFGKRMASFYSALPDEDKYTLTNIIAPIAETIATVGTGGAFSTSGKVLKKGAEAGIKTGKEAIEAGVGVTRASLQNLPSIKSLRLQLSDVDPQVETVLKRSNADEVNKYFQQAKNAKADPAKATPLELAGTKAEDAFNLINTARKDAVTAKKNMLKDKAGQTLLENPAGNLIDKIKIDASDRFGIKINPDGTLSTVSGRVSKLDKPSQKLITDYVAKLRQLGINPTAQKVDDFVDWAQGQLYKQSKEVSTLKSADDATVSYLKGITGELNDNLKSQVGGGYGEVNARISRLIELEDELGKALGADARKGGGLMKKLFSPTGGDTRRIFEEIQKETGIDLFKEATLAKFAMESVGDVRQKSLLKQLDVALQETAELDLTKPLSIVKWLREKADLDGQELANQLLREISASSDVKK